METRSANYNLFQKYSQLLLLLKRITRDSLRHLMCNVSNANRFIVFANLCLFHINWDKRCIYNALCDASYLERFSCDILPFIIDSNESDLFVNISRCIYAKWIFDSFNLFVYHSLSFFFASIV